MISTIDLHIKVACSVKQGNNIFVKLGFSSNVPLQVNSGRLHFDSLVAKPLSNLYNDSCSNFQQSNA
jgi:hypothetical protein